MPLPVTEPPAQQNKIEDNILHFPLPSDASHSVSISLLGATVISWKANAIEQLYLSPLTVDPNVIQGKKAIRGGIPLIFPIFGKNEKFPNQHGFARNLPWTYDWSLTSLDEGEEENEENVAIQLSLKSKDLSLDIYTLFPFHFEVILSVKLFKNRLEMTLQVHHLCSSENLMSFEALFHTYFKISHISNVSIEGLQDLKYSDKLQGDAGFVLVEESLRIKSEVDRTFKNTPTTVTLTDANIKKISIQKKELPDLGKTDCFSKCCFAVLFCLCP